MARSDTLTLIPLDRVAAVLGLDPLHFNSIYSEQRPERFACDDMWYQHDWQSDVGRFSRNSFAFSLQQAEDIVASYLGYYPAPVWFDGEEHYLRGPFIPELQFNHARNIRGRAKSLETRWGYVVETGTRTKTLIEAGSVVTYSDPDGDGYNERATVSVTTTVTDIEEIRVYYPGESGSDAWEIRPVDVSIAGGIATITFPKHLSALPELIEIIPSETVKPGINGDIDANFLTTVDVYRVYTDPSVQATFGTENTGCLSCGGTGCEACGFVEDTGCLFIRNPRLGVLGYAPATWDETLETFDTATFTNARLPDKITIAYRAGKQNKGSAYPNLRMQPDWEKAIVHYAITLISDEICSCENTKARVDHLRTEMNAATREKGSHFMTQEMLNNPLGWSRAAYDLWRMIKAPGNRLGKSR